MNNFRPHILIINNIPTPYRISFFEALAGELEEFEISLSVLFLAHKEPYKDWSETLSQTTIQYQVLPGMHIPTPLGTLHYNPSISWKIREMSPRLVLFAGSWNYPTVLQALALRSRNLSRWLFWSEGHRNAVHFSSGIIAKVRSRVLSHFDGFVVPNIESQTFIEEQLGRTAHFLEIPNTVDTTIFTPNKERQFSIQSDGARAISILVPARLAPEKGIGEILAVIEQLPDDARKRLQITFVSDGPLRENVIKAASQTETISYLGVLHERQMVAQYQSHDVALLASTYDPNPLALIEAASCGMYLAASDRVGNAPQLIGDDNGFIFDTRNKHGLLDALSSLASTPRRDILERGQRSRRLALLFDTRVVAASTAQSLARLSVMRPKPP